MIFKFSFLMELGIFSGDFIGLSMADFITGVEVVYYGHDDSDIRPDYQPIRLSNK